MQQGERQRGGEQGGQGLGEQGGPGGRQEQQRAGAEGGAACRTNG
ncbi:hypothetical protein [Streptomyces sp. Tu 3180]|nr:hypothetical protein [Streptomyces sp. Tu 3180]